MKTINYELERYQRIKSKRRFLSSIGIDYNHNWEERQRYLYFTFKIDRLNNVCLKEKRIPIFLTITLPSVYHTKGKRKNIKYGSISIRDGYLQLNYIFRNIIKNFKVDSNYQQLKYVKVIEPHKDFTPHLHSIIWVKEEHLNKLLNYLNRIFRRFDLEQTDMKILDKADYATVYLLKYVQKGLKDLAIRGWAQYWKIRQYTMSRTPDLIDFYTFRILTRYIKYDKTDNRDYIMQILDKVTIFKTIRYSDGRIANYEHRGKNTLFYFSRYIDVKVQKVILHELEEEETIEDINPYYKNISYHLFDKNLHLLDFKGILFNIKEKIIYTLEDSNTTYQFSYIDLYK